MWVKAVQKPWPSRAYVPQHVSSIMVKEVSALLGQKEIELSDAEVPKANDKIWEQPHSDWSVFCQCRWWKVYIVRQRRGEHFVWERRVSLSSEKVRPPALLLLRNGLFTHITLQHRNPEVRDTACTCWPIWRGWRAMTRKFQSEMERLGWRIAISWTAISVRRSPLCISGTIGLKKIIADTFRARKREDGWIVMDLRKRSFEICCQFLGKSTYVLQF